MAESPNLRLKTNCPKKRPGRLAEKQKTKEQGARGAQGAYKQMQQERAMKANSRQK
jgi:hypothetical protein